MMVCNKPIALHNGDYLLPLYRASRLPVVLDHMAGVDPARGLNDPHFQTILASGEKN